MSKHDALYIEKFQPKNSTSDMVDAINFAVKGRMMERAVADDIIEALYDLKILRGENK